MTATLIWYVSLVMKWDHDGGGLPLGLLLSGTLAWAACSGLGITHYSLPWFSVYAAVQVATLPPLCFVFGRLTQSAINALMKPRV